MDPTKPGLDAAIPATSDTKRRFALVVTVLSVLGDVAGRERTAWVQHGRAWQEAPPRVAVSQSVPWLSPLQLSLQTTEAFQPPGSSTRAALFILFFFP